MANYPCPHYSATGVDHATGPDKVWRCDGCGRLYRSEPDPEQPWLTRRVWLPDAEFRHVSTAELREAAQDPQARFEDTRGDEWRWLVDRWQCDDCSWHRSHRTHAELSRCLLRRLK